MLTTRQTGSPRRRHEPGNDDESDQRAEMSPASSRSQRTGNNFGWVESRDHATRLIRSTRTIPQLRLPDLNDELRPARRAETAVPREHDHSQASVRGQSNSPTA
jgi:hypothetical protein